MDDLKPCPCCGSDAELKETCFQGINLRWITCTKCVITTEKIDCTDWGCDIFKQWNSRAIKEGGIKIVIDENGKKTVTNESDKVVFVKF